MKKYCFSRIRCVRVFFMVFFAGTAACLYGQEHPVYALKGEVGDGTQTLPYANVALLSADSAMVAAGAADAQGVFLLKAPAGRYVLRASFMGYRSLKRPVELSEDTDLGRLVLEQDEHLLSDVVVTARLTERRADRLILNLAGSPLAAGRSVKEVLRYAPGVWVDPRGSISINGNSSVRVMINDRDVRMSGEELVNYLETLRAEDVLKIEVIPVAGAEYEANSSGGIVRITLRKQALEGMNGSLSLGYTQQKYPAWTAAGNLNYRRDRWSTAARYQYNDQTSMMDTDETTVFESSATRQQSHSYYKNPAKNHYADLEVVYEISPRSETGVEVEYYNHYHRGMSRNTTLSQSQQDAFRADGTVGQRETESNVYATAFYKIRTDTLDSQFKFMADLMRNSGESYLHSDAWYFHPDDAQAYMRNDYTQRIPSATTVYTVKADFDKKTSGALQYALGAKYADSSIDSDSYFRVNQGGAQGPDLWQDDAGRSYRFRYRERVWAGYGRLSGRLWGMAFTAGLRVENTAISSRSLTLGQDNAQSYFDWFPSASLQRSFGKDGRHSVSANYSRRISRPYYGIFNPYTIPLSEFSSVVGNPDIRPSYVDRYALDGVLFSKYSATLSYTRTHGDIGQMVLPDPHDPARTVYQHVNFGDTDRLSLSLFAPVQVCKWWGVNINASATHYRQREKVAEGQTKTNFMALVSAQNNLRFNRGWTLDVSGFYQSPQLQGNMRIRGFFTMGASVVKQALENRLTISLRANDILGTLRLRIDAQGEDFCKYTRNDQGWQSVGLSVRWNFSAGRKDVKFKKVESGSQDERGRL